MIALVDMIGLDLIEVFGEDKEGVISVIRLLMQTSIAAIRLLISATVIDGLDGGVVGKDGKDVDDGEVLVGGGVLLGTGVDVLTAES